MNPLISKLTGQPVQEQDEEAGMVHGAAAPGEPAPGEPAPAEPAPEAPPEAGAEAGPYGQDWKQRLLDQVKQRFMAERINGFVHPMTGEQYPPDTPENVEARWQKKLPLFIEVINNDPDVERRFGPRAPAPGGGEGVAPEGAAVEGGGPVAPPDLADEQGDLPESSKAGDLAKQKLEG